MPRHPNRAARLETMARLAMANHATTLLRSKEEALERERSRLVGHEDRSRTDWIERCRQATEALLRARAMGASDEITRLIQRGPSGATISADWEDSMGISYPGEVTCRPASPTDLAGTAALVPAMAAFRSALEAAARHAATTMALERLDLELGDTRRRRRAIGDHLVPRIDAELRALELVLDEQDREEAVRSRLAKDRQAADNVDLAKAMAGATIATGGEP